MKICVDIRCLSAGRKTGVEEYTLNLLENLFKADRRDQYVLFLNSFSAPKVDLSRFEKYPNVSLKFTRIPNKILNFLFWYFRWPKIDKIAGGADAVFLPNIVFSAVGRRAKLVVAFHDLSFERFPEKFSFKRRVWHWFVGPRRLAQRADRIIAVSESTKNDLVEIYQINPSKIKVVYSACGLGFRPISRNSPQLIKVKEKYGLPYNFILFLGTIEPRKNIVGIVRAYNQLRALKNEKTDKYKLVIAGHSGWKQESILKEIADSPFRGDILVIGYVDDADKPALYNLSGVFVYPSFFEGFGFPPLEAMSCGVPVVTSNNSSFPEVVGKGGMMADPDRPDEIFQAVKNILLDKNLREDLVGKGLEQARKFDWQKTAREVLEIMQNLEK
jgi:glycosyltransferase involved in cell wall biosynthesis